MRIARIITRLNVGGPAYQAVILNHEFRCRGHETLLIAGACESHEGQFDSLLRDYPGAVEFCPHLRRNIQLWNDARALAWVWKRLKAFRPDVVHTHTAKAGWVGRTAAHWVDARAIFHTFHGHVLSGYFSPRTTKMIVGLERYLARQSDRVITISRRLADELVDRYHIAGWDRVNVVELGLPLDRFLRVGAANASMTSASLAEEDATNVSVMRGAWRKRLGISDQAKVIGALGRLVPIKNFARMISAFALMRHWTNARHDVHVLIGGTGPMEAELREQAACAGVGDRVHFVGQVDDLPTFYADVDAVMLTSDNEGTPVVLLEAQAAGRWVIAGDVGGVSDVVGANGGVLVRPNEPEAFARAMAEWADRGVMWTASMVDRQAIVERFAVKRLADELEELYRIVLEQHGTKV